jgi:hypothetical protein
MARKQRSRKKMSEEEVNGFDIEDGVSAPSSSQMGKILATMDKLEVGQSFKVPGKSKIGSASIQSYYKTANGHKNKDGEVMEPVRPDRQGRKFRTRGDGEDHFRVWRTE